MRLLIAEDEGKLARALQRGLRAEGFAVDCVFDGAATLRRMAARGGAYDLLLLDVMLPGRSGLDVCRELRRNGAHIPILMLTARDATEDRVLGLETGADDYVVKPFAFAELLARIRTLLRRPQALVPDILVSGTLALDPATRRVTCGDGELRLTPKEFSLLEYFLRHSGEVVRRQELFSHLWDFAFDPTSNVIDVHVTNLRRKLAARRGAPRIQTERGVGYRLAA